MPRIEDAGQRLDKSTTEAIAQAAEEMDEPTTVLVTKPQALAKASRKRTPARKPAPTTPRTPAPKKPRTEDVAAAMREKRLRAFEEQEKRRANRLMADTPPSLIFAMILAATGLVTSFMVSYSTLVAVAGWMLLEQSWLAYIVPAFIEAMIVFSTIDYIIARSRGASTSAPFAAIVGFSVVAVIGNLAHSLSGWLEQGQIPWFGYVGIAISALVPLVVVYLSKRLATLVFSEPIKLEDES